MLKAALFNWFIKAKILKFCLILEKKVGNTYIFDVAISHEVKPILKGIRYSLIWFIQNNHVKVKSNKFL